MIIAKMEPEIRIKIFRHLKSSIETFTCFLMLFVQPLELPEKVADTDLTMDNNAPVTKKPLKTIPGLLLLQIFDHSVKCDRRFQVYKTVS